MRCGEKCFLVTIERNGQTEEVKINARSNIEARKMFRKNEEEIKILKVQAER